MRAAVVKSGHLEVVALADPEPGAGQVLVRTLACGICGSDLHAAGDLDHFAELTSQAGGPGGLDPAGDLVFGHEFCAEVVSHGPATEGTLQAGTPVCSVPIVFGGLGPEAVGYSNAFPGGFGEYMVLQEAMLLPVPEGLAPERAALTEPLAVGEHAAGLARLSSDDVCLVVGAGPVGLAVLAALKRRGHGPVIVAEFSPARRRLAEDLGADVVVDPAEMSPYSRWSEFGVPATMMERAMSDFLGGAVRNAVIFEAVGSPGVLQSVIAGAPPRARLVVVGVCMETDRIEPFFAVTKELDIQFSFGYSAAEFGETLAHLGRGALAVDRLVTHEIDLAGLPAAFEALRNPGEYGKVLVRY